MDKVIFKKTIFIDGVMLGLHNPLMNSTINEVTFLIKVPLNLNISMTKFTNEVIFSEHFGSVQYSRMHHFGKNWLFLKIWNGRLFCTFSWKVYTQKINNISEILETKCRMCTWIFLVSPRKTYVPYTTFLEFRLLLQAPFLLRIFF